MRYVFAVITLLASAGAAGIPELQDDVVHAVCRPSTSCEVTDHTTNDGFIYRVKGHKIVVNYLDSKFFTLWCNSDGSESNNLLSADYNELPVMPQPVTVEKVVFNSCEVPQSSYYKILSSLNVTVSKDLLLRLPAGSKLEKDHLRGLEITNLEISADNRPNPPRASFDYLSGVPSLISLRLTDVISDPEAYMRLPVTLETLYLVGVRLPAAEVALREGSNRTTSWLERLHSLRTLHIVEYSTTANQYPGAVVTLPQLALLSNLTSASFFHVPLDTNSLSSCFKGSAVKNLVLKACGLTELSGSMFQETNVTKINLTNNNLSSLPDYVFSPLKLSLRELDLSYNNLNGRVLRRTLPALTRLETLKVNDNPLGSLCGGGDIQARKANSFLPTSLRRLELSGTHAIRICSDWVENDALMYINLSNNDFENVSYNDLAMKRKPNETVTSPVQLYLNDNPSLRYIEVFREDVEQCINDTSQTLDDPDIWTHARVKVKLTSLVCECEAYWLYKAVRECPLLELDGDVSCISETTPPVYESLLDYKPDEFLCSYNEACLPGAECSCWKRPKDNATVVKCEGVLPPNPQWPPAEPGWPLALHVPPGSLVAVPPFPLVELHAPNNNITSIDEKDIYRHLSLLDLRNNSIAHISLGAAQLLDSQSAIEGNKSVYLAGNLLACECADAATFGHLKRVVRDWKYTRCMDQSLVSEKTKSDLCNNRLLTILFGVVVPVLLMVVAALLIHRMLPHIKQFMFHHNLCLKWILSVNDNINDPDKTHDVFLSYAYEDLEQLTILKSGLEKLGYSTIDHCRDWLPGGGVIEQISRSVVCARRTLLLVSDKYAESNWAMEEFHAAHAHAMKRRTARVLIVRCGLEKPETLPTDLQHYLYNHTYLAWEDPKFWYKLCCNMPPLDKDHKSVLSAALDMAPPNYKEDTNKNLPVLEQVPLESQFSILQHSDIVPGAC